MTSYPRQLLTDRTIGVQSGRVCQSRRNKLKHPVCGCCRNQLNGGSGKLTAVFTFFIRGILLLIAQPVSDMEPFASAYANRLPSWHYGGHFDRSFHNDSAYASEDCDFVPFPSLDLNQIYEDTDEVDRDSPRTRRHRAAAIVNAQWSRPAVSGARHPLDDSFDDNWRIYDLPQPLPFEEQRYIYDSGSRLRPTAFYDRENFGREPGHAASWWGSEESIPALEFEEHRARVPDALPSLNNRIESGTDRSSPSSISTRHGSRSPEEVSQSGGSTTSTQPDHRTRSSMRSSARRPRRNQSSSRDTQLAAAWQQLYHERTELEEGRRALRKKE